MKIYTEYKSELFIKKFGVKVTKSYLTKGIKEALALSRKVNFPLVVKIISQDILHKTDAGGVIKCSNKEDLIQAYYKILSIIKEKKASLEGILIQEYITGNEIIIGIKKDPTFGHIILFGLGGVYTEVLKDVSLRVCPINKKEALRMINEIKNIKILEGYRKQKPVDKNVLSALLMKISQIPLKNKGIAELDINPLIANGKSIIAVDARMIIN
ncbi:acetate--CoA ligase family protein [Candidatus Woesearchaeota archaeon]|nr:acetate--CoA ligase family protein [Candidatus Woesearchaeota archaeon]